MASTNKTTNDELSQFTDTGVLSTSGGSSVNVLSLNGRSISDTFTLSELNYKVTPLSNGSANPSTDITSSSSINANASNITAFSINDIIWLSGNIELTTSSHPFTGEQAIYSYCVLDINHNSELYAMLANHTNIRIYDNVISLSGQYSSGGFYNPTRIDGDLRIRLLRKGITLTTGAASGTFIQILFGFNAILIPTM